MKVVINKCFGGFGLSPQALLWLWDRGCKVIAVPVGEYFKGNPFKGHQETLSEWKQYLAAPENERRFSVFATVFTPCEGYVLWHGFNEGIGRSDPLLIECVEVLGDSADGPCAKLEVVEIPDGIEWEIEEYEGREHIAEKHRTWA